MTGLPTKNSILPNPEAALEAPAVEANQTPKEIVSSLDRYIIGQKDAKKAVAIALRNRWRRLQLEDDMRDEILPKNIIMIGPTGVGKTEIARRIARLVKAPFIKVEASKFTEVGYVGRDVESIVRDLADYAVNMVRQEQMTKKQEQAKAMVEERLLDLLLPPVKKEEETEPEASNPTREKFREKLSSGALDDKMVELDVAERVSGPVMEFMPVSLNDNMDMNIRDMLSNIMPKRQKRRRVSIADARGILQQEEVGKLIDMDEVNREAVNRVEETGIVVDRGSSSHRDAKFRADAGRFVVEVVEHLNVVGHRPQRT